MSDRIPTFDGTPQLLDSYEREVALWAMSSTPLRPEQRAPALALRLTDRAKVISQGMVLDELHQDRGIEYLLDFLRANLRITNMHYLFDIFRQFINMRRDSRHSDVDLYITEFYQLYMKLVQVNIRLPEEVVTLLMIEHANLSDQERSLVDSIMLSNPQNAFSYDRANQALRQILRRNPTMDKSNSSASEAFVAQDDLTDIECFSDDGSEPEVPFEINYVKRNGRFFRRIPRRFVSQFHHNQRRRFRRSDREFYYGKGKGMSRGKHSYSGTSNRNSYPQTLSSPSGKRTDKKGKGRGKTRQRVYVVEPESTSTDRPEFFPPTEVFENTEYEHERAWDEWYEGHDPSS